MLERPHTVLRQRVDFENNIKLVQFIDNDPNTVAVFDGDEKISPETSAIQSGELVWFFDGYVAAKESESLKSKGDV